MGDKDVRNYFIVASVLNYLLVTPFPNTIICGIKLPGHLRDSQIFTYTNTNVTKEKRSNNTDI